ncbi:hypothetical protein BDW74DRAFT_10389 [Aspergillus multicolor]|uniref:uncharacterized protein n=1 Tax=Aspergillus multicolor TaxID=41759 RepID=UPI003CCD6A3A
MWRINPSLMLSIAASACCLLDAPRPWRVTKDFRATNYESLDYNASHPLAGQFLNFFFSCPKIKLWDTSDG